MCGYTYLIHTYVCAQMHIHSTILMLTLNINSNLIWGFFLFAGFLGQRVFSLKFGEYFCLSFIILKVIQIVYKLVFDLSLALPACSNLGMCEARV